MKKTLFAILALCAFAGCTNMITSPIDSEENTTPPVTLSKIGVLPDTTSLVSPLLGSTVSTPYTFRWRKVPGATKYWLSASVKSNWNSIFISDSTLTDTCYTEQFMCGSPDIHWNVATGNESGWNKTSWTTYDWYFTATREPVMPPPEIVIPIIVRDSKPVDPDQEIKF